MPRIILAIWGLRFAWSLVALATGPISVGDTTVVNEFPERLEFSVEAESAQADIVSVELRLTLRGDKATAILPAEFTSGRRVQAKVEWSLAGITLPPFTPVNLQWAVRDSAGNAFTGESEEYLIEDPRFEWRHLDDERLAVWWYEGGADLGQRVFDTAGEALDDMQAVTGTTIPHRLHVVLYANHEDFASWQEDPDLWAAGQAYSETGLTVQVIPSDGREAWIGDVVPHEVAHLFFYEVTHTALTFGPPTWLVEGFATYHETTPHPEDLEDVRQAMIDGDLVPLRRIIGSLSGDDDDIHLLYAESYSAVSYLYEQWGPEAVGDLLRAFRQGRDTDEALSESIGLNFEEFQQAWWEWLGGEPDAYPTPAVPIGATPRPPEERPTPTGGWITRPALPTPALDSFERQTRAVVAIAACLACLWIIGVGALVGGGVWLLRRPRARSDLGAPGSPKNPAPLEQG